MGVTNDGLKQTAKTMGGGDFEPSYIAIGTGSSTTAITDTGLNNETDRNQIAEINVGVDYECTWIANYSAGELSGTTVTEFGLFNSTSGAYMYQNEVIGSIEFNGTREMQIQMSHKYVHP